MAGPIDITARIVRIERVAAERAAEYEKTRERRIDSISISRVGYVSGWTRGFDLIDPRVLMVAQERGRWTDEKIDELERDVLDWQAAEADHLEWIGYVASYIKFREAIALRNVTREQKVESSTTRTHGRYDLRAELEHESGDLAIFDLKTPKALSPWWSLQLAGYGLCFTEPHRRFSVQLKADGSMPTVTEYTAPGCRHLGGPANQVRLFMQAASTTWAQVNTGAASLYSDARIASILEESLA